VKRSGYLRCGAGAAAAILTLTVAWSAIREPTPTVPTLDTVRAAHRPSETRLLDRNGDLLHEVRTDLTTRRLAWVTLSEVSPALIAAVLASEDRRFYEHGGVDLRAIVGAVLQRIAGGPRRGASTISMQVATLLSPGLQRRNAPRTTTQKWRQARHAWALESRWSKAQILEAYLNRVTFRGEVQGVGAAAAVLFGKAPHGLTEAEAAILAALIRSPNAGREVVARRAWAVRETSGGRSTREQIDALAARIAAAPSASGPTVALAPHAARRVLAERTTPSAGEVIRTTLDADIQRVATELMRRHLLGVQDGHVQDGAILVADNLTGEVLAYVGGSGRLSSARQVDGIQAKRQAGSTLKPFLYGVALDRRLLTAASLLEDAPLDVVVAGGVYRPRNYDDHFKGLMTVRTALASSVNIPAVRTVMLVGLDAFAGQLRQLGFALKEAGDFYGPSLALGSADVSLWELVHAYRSLATGGRWTPLRMTPASGDAISRRVYSEQTAFLVSSILADRESRSATFGLESPLATRFWTAVKTGTSKDMRDNWCIGYSRRYTVGVWVGNYSGEPMRDVSGVTGAAPVWLELMAHLHRDVPSAASARPDGIVAKVVSFPRGVEADRTEWFLTGTESAKPSLPSPAPRPVILAPADGTLMAIDPDIPPARQRIVFEARVLDGTTRWILDGADLGAGQPLLAWKPIPGRHTLALADPDGTPLDTVTFEVRGNRPSRLPDLFEAPE